MGSKAPEKLVVESANLRYSFYSSCCDDLWPTKHVQWSRLNQYEHGRHIDSKHHISELRKQLYVSKATQVGPYPAAAAEWQKAVGSVINKLDGLMGEMAAMDQHVEEAYRNSMRVGTRRGRLNTGPPQSASAT